MASGSQREGTGARDCRLWRIRGARMGKSGSSRGSATGPPPWMHAGPLARGRPGPRPRLPWGAATTKRESGPLGPGRARRAESGRTCAPRRLREREATGAGEPETSVGPPTTPTPVLPLFPPPGFPSVATHPASPHSCDSRRAAPAVLRRGTRATDFLAKDNGPGTV